MTQLVVGMGMSGFSVAGYWAGQGLAVDAVDSRAAPPYAPEFERDLPTVRRFCGENFYAWSPARYADYRQVAVSPGVAPDALAARREQLTNEAVLFFRLWEADAPPRARLLAVTGTNGKSTTVELAAHLCRAAGHRAEAVGNVGAPMLSACNDWRARGFPDVAVVELSSFQLELMPSGAAAFFSDAAAVLNIGDDHLDRHRSLADYAAIKGGIYRRAKRAVVNVDDATARGLVGPVGLEAQTITYSPQGDAGAMWRVADEVVMCGGEKFCSLSELSEACRAQLPSVLAALALTSELALPSPQVRAGLATFVGLPHRRQRVATINGVDYVNDSKATNVSAMLYALSASDADGIILIAGGDGKGQDFSPLASHCRALPPGAAPLRRVLLIGRDGAQIGAALADCDVCLEACADLAAAVRRAAEVAAAGEVVLLSPGCASFDMFSDYQARGAAFVDAARALADRSER